MIDVDNVRVTIKTLRELVNYEYAKVELLVPDIQDYADKLGGEVDNDDFELLLEAIERDVQRVRDANEKANVLRSALYAVEDYNL